MSIFPKVLANFAGFLCDPSNSTQAPHQHSSTQRSASPPPSDLQARCVFCRIAAGTELPEYTSGSDINHTATGNLKAECKASGRLLYKDDKLMAFRDRSPAARLHFLVCPIEHIGSVKDLRPTPEDEKLVESMLVLGKKLIQFDAPDAETKFGFHVPPFNSVHHLHLHCFALPISPSWKEWKYSELSALPFTTYISAERLLQQLQASRQKSSSV
mmetsp:Transcript_35403/g.67730  ORF Transcript_35403/g.67730 Transcript_35403/m.67730 type:complete len:214 (+) Transcript_35403:236-877(+)|eukprot:CAMPEP_0114252092 /NCGR_PEP_ID=MMETSP0058-20121206/15646_1 /TAXON_ID=36894 /ORGANISM="Pyramimonas parkeae, CCMP726" /LENGTH=213 /DNA_ID=CAMNT_0001365991 /DNA_START=207 /DNA_END=848 /DNA_ORIENTATION=-